MFEREVMISTLRKSGRDLARLVSELEDTVQMDGIDLRYCQETVKKVESTLRQIRKMDVRLTPATGKYGASYSNAAW